jgi:hypothetical protein
MVMDGMGGWEWMDTPHEIGERGQRVMEMEFLYMVVHYIQCRKTYTEHPLTGLIHVEDDVCD